MGVFGAGRRRRRTGLPDGLTHILAVGGSMKFAW